MSEDRQKTVPCPENALGDERIIDSLMACAAYLRSHTEGRGSQRRVLSFLHQRGPMTQRDILAEMGVRASSLSELLGKLEARGYVTKTRSGEDKRNYNVSITRGGAEALAEMQARCEVTQAGLLSGLSEEEKAQLSALLEKLQGLWKERPREERPAHHRRGRTPRNGLT